jgi:hypothetical protein
MVFEFSSREERSVVHTKESSLPLWHELYEDRTDNCKIVRSSRYVYHTPKSRSNFVFKVNHVQLPYLILSRSIDCDFSSLQLSCLLTATRVSNKSFTVRIFLHS